MLLSMFAHFDLSLNPSLDMMEFFQIKLHQVLVDTILHRIHYRVRNQYLMTLEPNKVNQVSLLGFDLFHITQAFDQSTPMQCSDRNCRTGQVIVNDLDANLYTIFAEGSNMIKQKIQLVLVTVMVFALSGCYTWKDNAISVMHVRLTAGRQNLQGPAGG